MMTFIIKITVKNIFYEAQGLGMKNTFLLIYPTLEPADNFGVGACSGSGWWSNNLTSRDRHVSTDNAQC